MKRPLLTFVYALTGFTFSFAANAGLDDVKANAKKRVEEVVNELTSNSQFKDTMMKSLDASNKAAGVERTGKEAPANVKKADDEWITYMKEYQAFKAGRGKEPSTPKLVTEISKNPCSGTLRQLKKKFPFIIEAFVMNRAGTNVCMIDPTSDYDQGDEDKFLKPYVEGTNPFVENPQRDESTKEFEVKVSMVLKDKEGKKAGVITVGVEVEQ